MQRMRMHPDLGGEDENAAVLNEAYSILADSENRAAYDKAQLNSGRIEVYKKAEEKTVHYAEPHPHQCAFCGVSHQHGMQNQTGTFCTNCHSPLLLADQSQIKERERRTIMRVQNSQALIFYTHWPQSEPCSARGDDISLNGMKFHSPKSLNISQLIKIETQALRAVARVTHCRKHQSGWAIGVQFIRLCFVQSRGAFVSGRV